MSRHILLVFPEAEWDLAQDIRELLEEDPLLKETDGEVKIAKNVKAAWDSLEERQYHYDLIVAYLHLPPDRMGTLDLSAQLGLAFLQSLRQKKRRLPSILVAPAKDEELFRVVKKLTATDLVLAGENLLDEVRHQAQKWLKQVNREPAPRRRPALGAPKPAEPKKVYGNVDIWLNMHSLGFNAAFCPGRYVMYLFERPDLNERKLASGTLWLDWSTLYKLAQRSKDLEDLNKWPWPQWRDELETVGGCLRKELCDRYGNFQKDFKCLLNKLNNNIENIRIRFQLSMGDRTATGGLAQINGEMEALVLEALLDDQQKFLMLQAPICRELELPADSDKEYQQPLFYAQSDDKALNCLIIESDTRGSVRLDQEKIINLDSITNLRDESKGLQEYLQGRHEVVLLSKERLPKNLSFKDWVAQVLEQEGPWDLVHYVGHSLYAEDKTGYLFFPGEKTAEPMDIEDFSPLCRLAKVRFLYLSSCQSSKDDFVFHLANQRIPAILGFRWKIDDDKAKEFALKFYEFLFKYQSLEQAFLETRRFVHEKYEDNRIWAAPLLLLQS